ncbi:creatininase family protein [Subtercola endophyticus]|uniref:creatininase family protein n=1 Tax=Subtercola endophyticus TaxID=2895559 RepID=UPI001E4379F8|nr:creatininase family protein [Subtercola endophyticus]UFS61025.1 creatininase family protein [Subtercola endophyticus]
MSRNLVELSSIAAVEALRHDSVIVLPTGAIEHHGPHLPLSTDFLVAEESAKAAVDLAAEAGVNAWLLPGLAYTKSDEHHWAPGTVWLSWETLMQTIVEIGESIAQTPCTRLVFYNGHGGNVALLQVACRELRRRFGLQTFLIGGGMPANGGAKSGENEFGLGIHGGHVETSVVLHLRPELVDMSRAVRSVPEHLLDYQYVGFGKPVSFGWVSNDFSPGGVIGDPTEATAEFGKAHFEANVAQAAAALAEIAVFSPAPTNARIGFSPAPVVESPPAPPKRIGFSAV